MVKYKISDLEHLTGIKAQTIRMWEQRYNVLMPHRTKTNIRFYDEVHVKKILNVVSLLNSGVKISAVSKLDEAELNKRTSSLALTATDVELKEELIINQMISSGLSYDEELFEKAFRNAILSFGLMQAYKRVFYPMLLKIGLLWTISELNPAQEHFVTNLVKQKLFAAIDSLGISKNSEKWILFLPSNELHDLGLLVANYGLRSKGIEVCYLGTDVPLANLYTVFETVNPSHCLMFSVKPNQQNMVNKYLSFLDDSYPNMNTFLCCNKSLAAKIECSKNQKIITNFDDFVKDILGD